MMTEPEKPSAPGFWRRLGAFCIDAVLLGVVGVGLGWLAFDFLARLGEWARLIGLVVATAYFGVLGSEIGGSATVGQRLLGLRVMGGDGHPMSLGRALFRALILVIPVIANGVGGRVGSAGPAEIAFAVVVSIAVYGVGLAQLYLLIFNRPSRRMVHDLVTGSAVVRTHVAGAIAPSSRFHSLVAGSLVVAVLLLGGGLNVYFMHQAKGAWTDLKPALASVEELPEVLSASIVENTSVIATVRAGRTTTHSLVVNARLKAWPRDPSAEARRLGRAAISRRPLRAGQKLVAALRYGFDLGIGSGWRSYSAVVGP